jgi:molybdenum cofactor biosynthesis enzyme MoaA
LNLQPGTAPTGNGPVRTYRIPGAQGTVGFISPLGEHFYETCNRLRLTADGKLRACLFKTGELDLRPALNKSQPLKPHIQECVRRKPAGHELWLKDISVESNRVPKFELPLFIFISVSPWPAARAGCVSLVPAQVQAVV